MWIRGAAAGGGGGGVVVDAAIAKFRHLFLKKGAKRKGGYGNKIIEKIKRARKCSLD